MSPRASLTSRVYRLLLVLLLPSGFVDAFLDDMLVVFSDLERRGGAAGWKLLAHELPGLLSLAVRERRTHRTIRAHHATARLEENVFDSLIQDVRFALRSLRRAPGFTAVALSTLALGVGANTAIFSVVNSVLLTPLRLNDPSRLMAVGETSKKGATGVGVTSPGSFYDWQSSARTMRIAGYTQGRAILTGFGDPQMLAGTYSVGGLMDVLGVRPVLGRVLSAADEDPAAPRVVVLSFDAWHRLFGDDRRVIGATITFGGAARTIVGVMPAGFTFPGAPNDYWEPSHLDAAFRANRDQYFITVVGRLTPGATLRQAAAEMSIISARLGRDWPKYNQGVRIAVAPLQDTIVGGVRRQLLVLMGAVAFVLLITCANLGNLLLARASGRRREIAIRHALGAGRGRVARQLVTESILLAVAGGAAGVFVGEGFLRLLLAAQVTTNLPRSNEIALDGRVLLFTLAVSIVAGLVFGSVPAWQLARTHSSNALREGTRGSPGHQWTRSALVVSELALALVLLTGAGLLLRSFELLRRVNPGVRTAHVLTFTVSPSHSPPTFYPATVDRLRALPGVESVALSSHLPISGRGIGAWFNRVDRPLPDDVKPTGEPYRVVTPEFFAVAGVRLVVGRLFDANDRRDAPAIIVNQALAKKYYSGENPLGKPVYLGAPDNRLFDQAPIVGVVADTHDAGLGADPLPTVYIPLAVIPDWSGFSYLVKTSVDPTSIASAARAVIRSLDPTAPIRNVQTFDEVVSAVIAPARWSTTLLGVFAGVALIMAVLGVFGVLSFIVTQRTRELGIRIALGASRTAITGMVVGRGLALVCAGLALGLAGALALTRFAGTLLFGVTPTDPITFVAVSTVLVGAAVMASYLPARRATKVDPIVALRAE